MHSHRYAFTPRQVWDTVGPTALILIVLSGCLHLAAVVGWLPEPCPALDMDRTVLIHQARSSRTPHEAATVLVGDSSCLMNVVATNLGTTLRRPVLNLATLSYVSLPTHARLLTEYARANPGRLETVVLLMHPWSLRLAELPEYYDQQVADYLDGRDGPRGEGIAARLQAGLGVDLLRGRVLSRGLRWPLRGAYGRQYGFTHDLDEFLTANEGSAIDPNQFEPDEALGSAEFRLSKRLELESGRFGQSLPEGVRLWVGLTPTPASFAEPDHASRCRTILEQLAAWLDADGVIPDLPTVLPDDQFASVTHLNAMGRVAFTGQLADSLRSAYTRPDD